jgi:single-strand DNA-binding protein
MSINKVILVGNVGKDPEVRHLESSVSVANFPLATSESYTNKAGEKVTQTEWHNIVCWRGLATVVEKYVKKGSQLYIEGRIRTRNYEQDGVKKYITEIYADEMQMLGKKDDGGNMESRPNQPSENSANTGNIDDNQNLAISEVDDLPF